MTDPDESRSGGPATPPPADPASTATDPGSEAQVNDPVTSPPATPPAAPDPATTPGTPAPAPTSPFTASVEPAPAPQPAPPAPAPAPAPAPMATPPPAAAASPSPASTDAEAGIDDDFDDWEDDFDDYPGPRWIGLVTAAGAGIVGVVTLQVLMVLVEAFSLNEGQRFGVPDDLFHRIGYPFGSLGSTAMIFLLLAAVLLALPAIFGEEVNDRHYAITGAALRTAVVLAVLVAIGSVLAVRGSLHEYSAKSVAVPGFVRVQFTSFLLATIGAAALAVVSALAVLRLRDDT